MGYERTYGDRNRDDGDYGRDYGSGRDTGYGARDYGATGWNDRGDNGRYEGGRSQSFGQDSHGGRGGQQDRYGYQGGRGDYGSGGYGAGGYGAGGYGAGGYGGSGYGAGGTYGRNDQGQGGYGGTSYGRREQSRAGYGRDNRFAGDRDRERYDQDDRGFFARAGDEVRSWFGDEEAERRRDLDQRYDERHAAATDRDYGEWRRGQIESLDRDYDEYRRENQTKFHNEFGSWRTERQTQRSSLDKVSEHMEVVGSDGQHVGTVDKVRGDKIILTKNDQDAGGHHHSIPSRWIQSVDDKVTIRKSAEEAKREWKDLERRNALFGDDAATAGGTGPQTLNRSFSGTYR